MGFLDKAKKRAAEAAEIARSKAEEAAALAREKAEVAGELARLKGTEISGLSAQLAEKVHISTEYVAELGKEKWNSLIETMGAAKDSSLSFLEMKIRSTVRGWNLGETIDAMKKAGEEKNVDVSALVSLVEKLKQFGEDGKE